VLRLRWLCSFAFRVFRRTFTHASRVDCRWHNADAHAHSLSHTDSGQCYRRADRQRDSTANDNLYCCTN
jgi:hypothetical protein